MIEHGNMIDNRLGKQLASGTPGIWKCTASRSPVIRWRDVRLFAKLSRLNGWVTVDMSNARISKHTLRMCITACVFVCCFLRCQSRKQRKNSTCAQNDAFRPHNAKGKKTIAKDLGASRSLPGLAPSEAKKIAGAPPNLAKEGVRLEALWWHSRHGTTGVASGSTFLLCFCCCSKTIQNHLQTNTGWPMQHACITLWESLVLFHLGARTGMLMAWLLASIFKKCSAIGEGNNMKQCSSVDDAFGGWCICLDRRGGGWVIDVHCCLQTKMMFFGGWCIWWMMHLFRWGGVGCRRAFFFESIVYDVYILLPQEGEAPKPFTHPKSLRLPIYWNRQSGCLNMTLEPVSVLIIFAP